MALIIGYSETNKLIEFKGVNEFAKNNHERINAALTQAGIEFIDKRGRIFNKGGTEASLVVDVSEFESIEQIEEIVRGAGFEEHTKKDGNYYEYTQDSFSYQYVTPVCSSKVVMSPSSKVKMSPLRNRSEVRNDRGEHYYESERDITVGGYGLPQIQKNNTGRGSKLAGYNYPAS